MRFPKTFLKLSGQWTAWTLMYFLFIHPILSRALNAHMDNQSQR